MFTAPGPEGQIDVVTAGTLPRVPGSPPGSRVVDLAGVLRRPESSGGNVSIEVWADDGDALARVETELEKRGATVGEVTTVERRPGRARRVTGGVEPGALGARGWRRRPGRDAGDDRGHGHHLAGPGHRPGCAADGRPAGTRRCGAWSCSASCRSSSWVRWSVLRAGPWPPCSRCPACASSPTRPRSTPPTSRRRGPPSWSPHWSALLLLTALARGHVAVDRAPGAVSSRIREVV